MRYIVRKVYGFCAATPSVRNEGPVRIEVELKVRQKALEETMQGIKGRLSFQAEN